MDSPGRIEPAREGTQPSQWTPFEGHFELAELMPELERMGVRKAAIFDDQNLSLRLLWQKLNALGVEVSLGPRVRDPYRPDEGVDIRPAFARFRDLIRTSPEKLLVICDAFLIQKSLPGQGQTIGLQYNVLAGISITEIIETLREAERLGHITILTSGRDLGALQYHVRREQMALYEAVAKEGRLFPNYDDIWAMFMPKDHQISPEGLREGIISGIERRRNLDHEAAIAARRGQPFGRTLRESLEAMSRNVANILGAKHRT